MVVEYVNPENFDKILKKILKSKKGKNIVRSRFDIESIILKSKPDFVVQLISSFKNVLGITYKILFWEQDEHIEQLIESNSEKRYHRIATSYKNGKLPGIVYLEDKTIDMNFLSLLLAQHFNYEMAVSPSLNIRVQICVNQEEFITLLDVYDDRGFDAYYLPHSFSWSLKS